MLAPYGCRRLAHCRVNVSKSTAGSVARHTRAQSLERHSQNSAESVGNIFSTASCAVHAIVRAPSGSMRAAVSAGHGEMRMAGKMACTKLQPAIGPADGRAETQTGLRAAGGMPLLPKDGLPGAIIMMWEHRRALSLGATRHPGQCGLPICPATRTNSLGP